MKTVDLRSSIVYGPIHSRRFGHSLGINILPLDGKFCTYSCVYCQYPDHAGCGAKLPTAAEVGAEVDEEFAKLSVSGLVPDWIMLSGNGEPTLHPYFAPIVDGLIRSRDRLLPGVPIGVLSNSSTCHRVRIRETLERLDGRFMKLDAGDMFGFHDVNRPLSMFNWGEVVEGLCAMKDVTLQSMFIRGRVDNSDERSVRDWAQAVDCIWPSAVQIYTVDREPQMSGVLPVEEGRLREIAELLRRATGIPASVYGEGDLF